MRLAGRVRPGRSRPGAAARPRHAEMAQQLRVPLEALAVEEPAPRRDGVRDGHVCGRTSGSRGGSRRAAMTDTPRPVGMPSLLSTAGGPACTRCGGAAGALVHGGEVQLLAQLLRLAARACVRVGVERRDRHPLRVHAAGREHERVEADGGDLLRARARAWPGRRPRPSPPRRPGPAGLRRRCRRLRVERARRA